MRSRARVMVTGATGFVGRHCVDALRGRFEVIASGRSRPALAELRDAGVCIEQLDLTVPDADQRLAEHDPDVIVHCAALSSPWGRQDEFLAANVKATDAVLRACTMANARLVHLSTPAVYTNGEHRLLLDESATLPTSFINHYAATKFEAEQHVNSSGVDAAILRPQAIVGAGDTSIAPRFLRVADRGFMPVIRGIDPVLDMTNVHNVVAAINKSCDQLLSGAWSGCETFNITNGDPGRLSELLRMFLEVRSAAVGGRSVRMISTPKPLLVAVARLAEAAGGALNREPPVTRYTVELLATSRTLDICKAREMLDYDPSHHTIERAFVDYFAPATS